MTRTVIRVKNVVLEFPVSRETKSRREVPAHALAVGGQLRDDEGGRAVVRALDDVSFDVQEGDRVGLIGRNGAGKSSLLRLLAGIYEPTSGVCRVRGRISTLFGSSLGLNMNASGYENILLAGTLLGLSREQLQAAVPEIAAFCELGDFLEMPLRTYSSGMRTRLGFAIATSIHPDILLIDEVFGAGDRQFRNKARERIMAVTEKASTLVIASHSNGMITRFCNKAIWLEQGRVRAYGSLREVLEQWRSDGALAQPRREEEMSARQRRRQGIRKAQASSQAT